MTDSQSSSCPDKPSAASADALSDAFADSPESAAAVPQGILALTPEPISSPELDELVELQRGQRILRMKTGAVISVAALLAVLISLAFHSLIFTAGYMLWSSVRTTLTRPAIVESGGSGDGMIAIGDAPQPGPAAIRGNLNEILGATQTTPAATPPLPALDTSTVSSNRLEQSAEDLTLSPFGESTLGTPKPRTPPLVVQPPSPVNIAPPPAVASENRTAPGTGAGGNAVASAGRGNAGDGGDEYDRVSLMNGSGGVGNGRGHHAGDGIDRGESGANNLNPQVLEWGPKFDFVANGRKLKPILIRVTVLPDAHTGGMEILQSSGDADLDAAFKTHISTFLRFRPAYRAGKPIAASIDIGTLDMERNAP